MMAVKEIDGTKTDGGTNLAFNIFWTGFIIYIAGYTITTTTVVNYILCQAIQIVGIILFISASIKLIQFRFDNIYLKTITSKMTKK